MIMYSKSEYEAVNGIALAFSTISMIGSLFMCVTWLVFPQKRQQRHVLYFCICLVFLAFWVWLVRTNRMYRCGAPHALMICTHARVHSYARVWG